MCEGACIYTWRPEVVVWCPPEPLSALFLETRFSLHLELGDWPAWLAGRVRDSPVSAGEAAVPAFTWVLGNKCTPSCCAASTLATELSSKSAPQIDVIDLYVCVVSVCVVGTFACCGHTCARHVKAGLMSCNSPL